MIFSDKVEKSSSQFTDNVGSAQVPCVTDSLHWNYCYKSAATQISQNVTNLAIVQGQFLTLWNEVATAAMSAPGSSILLFLLLLLQSLLQLSDEVALLASHVLLLLLLKGERQGCWAGVGV